MTITHDDIKQRFHESVEKIQVRTSELHNAGQLLLKSYRDSLSLPADMFVDSKGFPRGYVSTGVRDGNVFQQKSISSLHLNDLVLTFLISTVIDETKRDGLENVEVPVSIYKEAGAYIYQIGAEQKAFRVVSLNAADAFYFVNNAIKQCVIASFADPRLDH